MASSWNPTDFPNLKSQNHKVTSPRDTRYNCIAHAAGDAQRWWWPSSGVYWPPGVEDEPTIAAFVAAFATLGYEPCASGEMEEGLEKIVLYVKAEEDGSLSPTHAARQLPDGNWTSKLGMLEDINHDSPDAVACGIYGTAKYFFARRRAH